MILREIINESFHGLRSTQPVTNLCPLYVHASGVSAGPDKKGRKKSTARLPDPHPTRRSDALF